LGSLEIASGEDGRQPISFMKNLSFARQADSTFKVLCLGAHSDDIEIGCGGTVLRLLEENPDLEICWVVLGANGLRKKEAIESAHVFLGAAQKKEVITKEFRDGYFPQVWDEIKDFFEELKKKCQPDLILTHHRADLHQDHRLVSELTWNTFRNHLILEYEIIKYDGDLGAPNLFVQLTDPIVKKKIETILNCFKSQKDKSWFTEDTFASILRLRGVESNSPGRYAEAFYGRKMVY
jgi:LmbE family N-acetylglucosaminyl deacetylase